MLTIQCKVLPIVLKFARTPKSAINKYLSSDFSKITLLAPCPYCMSTTVSFVVVFYFLQEILRNTPEAKFIQKITLELGLLSYESAASEQARFPLGGYRRNVCI